MIKTRAEVEALKKNWIHDPCWDIYDTEGFEEYQDELREFQMNMDRKWKIARYDKVKEFAKELCIDKLGDSNEAPNLQLANYLMNLEERIKELEDRV